VVPLAIVGWAVLEIWLLIVVAGSTSGLVVLLLILAGIVLGAAAVKRAGRSAWRNLAASVQPGPDGQGADAPLPASGGGTGLAMLGGLLLMIPGFLSDAVGLLCLFPPTRALIARTTERALRRRPAHGPGTIGDLYQQARAVDEQIRIHRPDGKVIRGEVVDRDKDQ
jgi:UPF0716 protein FxsA